MKRKWIKRTAIIILAPILLFVVLMLSLYIPPVQNLLRKELTRYASQSTGMQISMRRIDLRFPFNLQLSDVGVIQHKDTLLSMGSLNVRIQVLPLFRGEVEVDDLTLRSTSFNSAHLIKGMQLQGVLGTFSLRSHGVDLSHETALVNALELSDTHVRLKMLKDTVPEPKDTTTAKIPWKIILQQMEVKNVSFSMQLDDDSTQIGAHLGRANLQKLHVDLHKEAYALRQLAVNGSSVRYLVGQRKAHPGFDPSHIQLRDVNFRLDSLSAQGHNIQAVIRSFSMNERSGLTVQSLSGRLLANQETIRLPQLALKTPHSQLELTANTTWSFVENPDKGDVDMLFDARIGKQDVLLFAGALPEAFRKEYPFRPLMVRATLKGNLSGMQLSQLKAELPGAFSASGGGELINFSDSVKRYAQFHLQMLGQNLDFLTTLASSAKGRFAIPANMTFITRAELRGDRLTALLRAKDGESSLSLTGSYHTVTEAYSAQLMAEGVQVKHFLPLDSIYSLSARAEASGKGIDFMSPKAVARFDFHLQELVYSRFHIADVALKGALKNTLLTANLTSNNELVKLTADAGYHFRRSYTDASLLLNVEEIDWYKLGYFPRPMKKPFAFQLEGQTRKDSVRMTLQSGDLKLNFRSRTTLEKLMKQSALFSELLMKQVNNKRLDHAALRKVLPSAGLRLTAGPDNPFSRYLAMKDITYNQVNVLFGTTPARGINGRATVSGLSVDSTRLDTVFLNIRQDTTRLNIRGGVINMPGNPQFVFKAFLTGEIRNEDAELMVEYLNEKGETGVLLGVNARPRDRGILLKFIPEEPIVAFRKFRFNEDNGVYLRHDKHVLANVEMLDKDGMGVRIHSLPDTTFLQNMDIELRRIRLAEISEALPYLPQFAGVLSAEAHLVQTATSLQISTESVIDELVYEHQRVGDVGLGATWLPGRDGMHYVNSYLTHEGKEVMTLNGNYFSLNDSLDVESALEHFPLQIANVFIPDQVVTLSGDLDGSLQLRGSTSKPLANGELMLDSVSVYASQAGARYWFDNRPVKIENSRMLFNQFSIYTTSKNPFAINGLVDFRNLSRPTADLTLKASNYTLLDAPRTKESLVYGKVFVDMNTTVRGPLDALVMRGNMNVLGNTDVTYVLKDSPLTVQDRLGDLVTFTSFADTLSQKKQDERVVSLGGLDMLMTVHIDPAVRLKADLSPDRNSRVELEGGGDLSLQYSPRGDLRLSGRYTLSGGILKYALPVIPLKEFEINDGSYVEWSGNPMDPSLNFKATERVRASVSQEGGSPRMVNFDVSVGVKNRMENLELLFNLEAPEDMSVQNELAAMSVEERSKQAIALLATGVYMAGAGNKSGGLDMGAALNSVLQKQIANVAGSALKTVNISFGMENYDGADAGGKRTDYNFRYAQRFFNNRVQVVIGGTISTGNETQQDESFIDNVSLEYRLDNSGTRYVRLFHNKDNESILEGEITETGVGIVLRKKMSRLSELFIFKRKK